MQQYLDALESELARQLDSSDPAFPVFFGMLRYHLGWVDQGLHTIQADSGKRVRALICLSACRAVGADWHKALPVAAAIELVHNFSLIHDDIQDNSTERRGRPALWKIWGLAQGINAGDALFVLARLALDRLNDHPYHGEIHRAFDQATLELTQGQFLDLSFEARENVSLEEYLQMIHGKTAALIRASAEIGALVGMADKKTCAALSRFGEEIGLAFQITDDILGIWGDPVVTGKSAASDIMSRKKSLPIIYALTRPEADELRLAYARPQVSSHDLPRILADLDAVGAKEWTEARAMEHYRAALGSIAPFRSEDMAQLHGLADAMVERNK